MGRIFTHQNPDIDALASVWAVKKYIPGFALSPVIFVSGKWDGEEMRKGDIAVDLEANGKGIKGVLDTSSVRHSSFKSLIETYAPEKDREILAPVTTYIDLLDSVGLPMRRLTDGSRLKHENYVVLCGTSIGSVFQAIRAFHAGQPYRIIQRVGEILDGILILGYGTARAEEEADRVQYFDERKLVAVIHNKQERSTRKVLFSRGVLALVYVEGYNIGVIRSDRVNTPMDHPLIARVVKDAGEEHLWFSHPAKFMYCHGSSKAPAKTPSRVSPEKLARATALAIEETMH